MLSPAIRVVLSDRSRDNGHVSLAALERSGLASADPKLGHRLEKECFDVFPDFSKLINSTDSTRLYLPTKFNFSDIDAALVRLDRKMGEGFVYPIQVTIAGSHKDSEAHFYSAQWDLWKTTFTRNGFEVSSTFVWIDRQGSSEEEKTTKWGVPGGRREPW